MEVSKKEPANNISRLSFSETQSSIEQTTTPEVNSTQTDNPATTKGQIQSNAGTQKGNNNTETY